MSEFDRVYSGHLTPNIEGKLPDMFSSTIKNPIGVFNKKIENSPMFSGQINPGEEDIAETQMQLAEDVENIMYGYMKAMKENKKFVLDSVPREHLIEVIHRLNEEDQKIRNMYKGLYQATTAQLRSMGVDSDSFVVGWDTFDEVED